MPGNKDEKNFPTFKCDELTSGVLTADTPKNFFDKIIINSFSIICFSTTFLLTVIICAAAFFRYILEGDLTGYEEWVKIFAFWLYFAAAAIGAYNRTHVSADLVQAYVPDGRLKDFLVFLKDVITVGVCLLFTWYGLKFFEFGFMGPLGSFMDPLGPRIAIPTTNVWRIPLWAGYLPVFLGLIFMAYYFTRDLFMSTRTLLLGRRNK
ncbi:MAG: TRAP transporter small permease subunit [Desulforhopalus sp.]|nr:TRAP transporter small permease subunit [Desulforhopalus sp.]